MRSLVAVAGNDGFAWPAALHSPQHCIHGRRPGGVGGVGGVGGAVGLWD